MFQLVREEFDDLKSRFVISSAASNQGALRSQIVTLKPGRYEFPDTLNYFEPRRHDDTTKDQQCLRVTPLIDKNGVVFCSKWVLVLVHCCSQSTRFIFSFWPLCRRGLTI